MTYADTIAGMEKTNTNIPGRTFDSSGTSRKALPKAIDSIIYAELPKDLYHIETAQMSKHLEDVLAV